MGREKLLHHPLSSGWVALEREVAADGVRLHFLAELGLDETVDEAFEQIVLGFSDTESSWLWPVEYEWSPDKAAGRMQEGSLVRMTYTVPRFDRREIPASPVTYVYCLARYRPEERLLEYRTHDHPLQGGAVVRVLPGSNGGSVISWVGHYLQSEAGSAVVQSMLQFLPLVFVTMDEHARARRERRRAVDGSPLT
jgi:hypothetical protein